uniref:Uncharacterized protein n=1 Tax=Fagus sylvatica TaxID=28930 RepID=A0A2N9ESR9_FAGSY
MAETTFFSSSIRRWWSLPIPIMADLSFPLSFKTQPRSLDFSILSCNGKWGAPVSWPVVDDGPETGRLELVDWRMALVYVAPLHG